jgi:hypothetical protein
VEWLWLGTTARFLMYARIAAMPHAPHDEHQDTAGSPAEIKTRLLAGTFRQLCSETSADRRVYPSGSF